MSDRRVTGIPVEESGDPLLDVRGRLLVDDRLADGAGAYARLREGLVSRLLDAERQLPDGYRLLVVEGYRPPVLQRRYFDSYKDTLEATFPEMSPDELHVAASRYVSPVEVAPHTAGAAVDLTLCTTEGAELDMGTAVNANPEESDGACYTAAPNVSAEARHHREILGTALAATGMVNYPTEWWHWSFGDRYWAMTTQTASATYGPVPF
jgi:D-alanyl-D-alanine dipeptidase